MFEKKARLSNVVICANSCKVPLKPDGVTIVTPFKPEINTLRHSGRRIPTKYDHVGSFARKSAAFAVAPGSFALLC